MSYYEESQTPVCEICEGQPNKTYICGSCSREFCFHFSNGFNPKECSNCTDDIVLQKSVMHTKLKVIRMSTGKLIVERREKGDAYKFLGEGMLLRFRRIWSLSDDEMTLFIEERKAEIDIAEKEQSRRKLANNAKLRDVKLNIPASTDGKVAKRGRKKGSVTAQIAPSVDVIRMSLAAVYKQMHHKEPTDQELDALVAAAMQLQQAVSK